MIQTILHTTEKGNSYIYDDARRLSLLIHPEIARMYEYSADVDSYYMKKYEYLKRNGFFAKPKLVDFERVTELMIKESIAQTEQIVFEVTEECNLNCTYCGYGELYGGYDKRNHQKINTRYAINLLKYIFDLKPRCEGDKFAIGFYGGEPLLNMSFITTIVEIVNQLNNGKKMDIAFAMTTNATLLHKYIDFLVANNFRLLISLDGNKENHSYRIFSKNKENSFRKVIESADFIQKYFPEYFNDKVSFNAVLHNRNSVKDICEFIYTRYHKMPRIAELAIDDLNPDKKDVFAGMFQSKMKSEAEYQKEELSLLRTEHQELSLFKELTDFLKYYSINYYVANASASLQEKEKYLPTSTCLPFSRKVFLTTQNKLLPCEKINYKYSMGIVTENTIIDFQDIAFRYNHYYDNFKKVCQNCFAYRHCGLCLYKIKNLDRLDTENIVCPQFYDQVAFTNKLYYIFSFLEKYTDDFFHILEDVTIT